MVVVTEEYLNRHATGSCGWTRRQVEAIGVAWPLVSGWKRTVIGKTISEAQASVFESRKAEETQEVIEKGILEKIRSLLVACADNPEAAEIAIGVIDSHLRASHMV